VGLLFFRGGDLLRDFLPRECDLLLLFDLERDLLLDDDRELLEGE